MINEDSKHYTPNTPHAYRVAIKGAHQGDGHHANIYYGGARRIYYIAKHLNPSLRSGYLTLRDRDPVESIFERNSLSEMSVDNC